jgi:hypothetical protein
LEVPSSTAKKTARIAVLILVLIALGAGAYLYYRVSQPLTGPAAVAGPPPGILSLIPSDAPVVVLLDAQALRTTQNSALGAIGSIMLPTPQQDPDYTQFVQATGFDYSRDLDRAAIAMWPTSFDADANASGDNRTLAIADGRFDQQRIDAYALRVGGHTINHGNAAVYEVPGKPPISFEFLSATRVELASGKNATDLLTNSSSSKRDSAMQARIDRVAGAPLFAVARTDHLPNSIYASFESSPQLLGYIRSIQAITLAGQPQGNNLDLTIDGQCDSMKNAVEIATLLNGFSMMGSVALKDPKERGNMTKQQADFLSQLLAKLKVTAQDKWVRLSIALTPKMLAGATSSH